MINTTESGRRFFFSENKPVAKKVYHIQADKVDEHPKLNNNFVNRTKRISSGFNRSRQSLGKNIKISDDFH